MPASPQKMAICDFPSNLFKHQCSCHVICYFANWAQLRASNGKFVPENIDARPCSHVFYAYANLDSVSFEIVPGNPLVDINDGYYNR